MSHTTAKLREYCDMVLRNIQKFEGVQNGDDGRMSFISESSSYSGASGNSPDNNLQLDRVHSDYVLSLISHNNPILNNIEQNEKLFSQLDK